MRNASTWFVLLPCSAFALAISATQIAHAEEPLPRPLKLDYNRERGAEKCPNEALFRNILGKRSGTELLAPDAPARLVITMRRERNKKYHVRAAIRTEQSVLWESDPVSDWDCLSAADAVGLEISTKLDTPSEPPPAPPAPPAPTRIVFVAPSPTSDRDTLPKKAPLEDAGPRFQLGLLGSVAFGSTPKTSVGGVVDLGLRWSNASAHLELLWAPVYSGVEETSVRIASQRFSVGTLPCYHWRFLYGCGMAQLTMLLGSSEKIANAAEFGPLYAFSLGPRAGVELPIHGALSARLSGDVLGTIYAIGMRVDRESRWTTSPLSGAVTAGLAASLF